MRGGDSPLARTRELERYEGRNPLATSLHAGGIGALSAVAASAVAAGIACFARRDLRGRAAPRATTTPALHPGARPCGGTCTASVEIPVRSRTQATMEFEFHMSPACSSSRPQTG